jgi:cytochrome c peroxidase
MPTDPGREAVSKDPRDFATFKTPSLRNLTVTGPYMHDGRIATLDDVVDHYSRGIVPSTTLDQGLARQNGGVHLSVSDHDALVAFLKTLVDSSFSKNIHP